MELLRAILAESGHHFRLVLTVVVALFVWLRLPWWLAAVTVGAVFGAWLGTKHLTPRLLRYVLAALLLTGGLWMLWNA